jgi:hypothetical protein
MSRSSSRDVVHMGSDTSPKARSRRSRRWPAGARGEVGGGLAGSVGVGEGDRAGASGVLVAGEGSVDSAESDDDGSFNGPDARLGQGPRSDDATSTTVLVRRRRGAGGGL